MLGSALRLPLLFCLELKERDRDVSRSLDTTMPSALLQLSRLPWMSQLRKSPSGHFTAALNGHPCAAHLDDGADVATFHAQHRASLLVGQLPA